MNTLAFRPATEADEPFLIELRRQTMAPHERACGIVRDAEASLRRVRARFDCAQIVLLAGQPIGLLKLIRDAKHWELLQIQLAPSVQGRGLGSALLRRIVAQARAAGASLKLHVLKSNPARKLYERHGFVVIAESEHAYEMRLRT